MRLSQAQIESYGEDGFLLLEDCFSQEEIELFLEGVSREFEIDSPRRILERSGAVRSVFAMRRLIGQRVLDTDFPSGREGIPGPYRSGEPETVGRVEGSMAVGFHRAESAG